MLDFEEETLDETPVGFWTLRRIIFTAIIIVTLIALLTYVLLANWYSITSRPTRERPAPTQPYQQG